MAAALCGCGSEDGDEPACGVDEPADAAVSSSDAGAVSPPEGTVGGLVVNAETLEPLAGARVGLLASAVQFDAVETTETGTFAFEGVPVGEVLLTLTAPADFRSVWLRDELSGGDPAGVTSPTLGPIGLVRQSETFQVRVLDAHGGPVSQYALSLEHGNAWVDYSGDAPVGRGSVLVEATTDGDGYASFAGLPDLRRLSPRLDDAVVVTLPPLYANGDDVLEYGGGERTFHLRALGDPTPDIVLDAGYETTLTIRNSTIGQLAGAGGVQTTPAVLPVDGVIHVAFNLPIQPTVEVAIGDEFGGPIAQVPALSITDDHLAIDFSGAPLLPGSEYNLQIHAVSAVGEQPVTGDFAGSFFTAGVTPAVTVAAITRDGSNRVDLEFSEPIGVGQAVALSGEAGCVTFFLANLADVNQINFVGDAPGELGNPSCNGYTLYMNEPDPIGLASPSGYTRYWYFIAPIDVTTNQPATSVDLLFSHVSNAVYVMRRADGTLVEDFTGATKIAIP